jgi:hypothetical protein
MAGDRSCRRPLRFEEGGQCGGALAPVSDIGLKLDVGGVFQPDAVIEGLALLYQPIEDAPPSCRASAGGGNELVPSSGLQNGVVPRRYRPVAPRNETSLGLGFG